MPPPAILHTLYQVVLQFFLYSSLPDVTHCYAVEHIIQVLYVLDYKTQYNCICSTGTQVRVHEA